MTPVRDERCLQSDAHLLELYGEALPLAQALLHDADNYIENGARAGAAFDRTFEG